MKAASILITDDQDNIRMMLRTALESDGYAVSEACKLVGIASGGKGPLIVCEDADLERAARAIVFAACWPWSVRIRWRQRSRPAAEPALVSTPSST